MTNNSILDKNYLNESAVLRLADAVLTPLAICTGHRKSTDGKTHHLAIRVFAGLAAVLIAPILLIALTVKWLKTLQKKADIPPTPTLSSNEKVAEQIYREMEKIRELDVKLGTPLPGSWREFAKDKETNQTLELYIRSMKHMALPDQQVLHIQRIGSFSELDLKIIDITCDFLRVMHGIPVKLQEETFSMEELKECYDHHIEKDNQRQLDELKKDENFYKETKRKIQIKQAEIDKKFKGHFPREADKMYEASNILTCLREGLKPALKSDEDGNPRVMAFTNEDIYHNSPKMDDFIYGLASLRSGTGVSSSARFGDPTKNPQELEQCLLRMMKVSSHEFSHMQNIIHCTDYECNVCGSMNIDEIDGRPLLYCAQDTAKICHLTQTSILEHDQKLLDFFENFNQKYNLQLDWSKEVRTLKARITKLSEK